MQSNVKAVWYVSWMEEAPDGYSEELAYDGPFDTRQEAEKHQESIVDFYNNPMVVALPAGLSTYELEQRLLYGYPEEECPLCPTCGRSDGHEPTCESRSVNRSA